MAVKPFAQNQYGYFRDSVCYFESIDEAKKVTTCDIGLELGNLSDDSRFIIPREVAQISRLVHLRISCRQEIIMPKEIGRLNRLKFLELAGRISKSSIRKKIMFSDSLEAVDITPRGDFERIPKALFKHGKVNSIQFNFIGLKGPFTYLITDFKKVIKKRVFKSIYIFGWKLSEEQKNELTLLATKENVKLVWQ